MKKVFLMVFVSVLLFSCSPVIDGNGTITSETYVPISNFTKVSLDAAIDITILQGTQKSVTVSGSENLLEYFKITATGGVLRIGMKPENTYTNMDLTAVVVMPSVTEIIATHAGNILVDSFPTIGNLKLETSGSGNISTMNGLRIGTLTANIFNSGSIAVEGIVNNQNISITGSGNYDAFNLFSNNSYVNIQGSGIASVNAKILLDATISGSGNILYKREPEIQSNLTGTGTIIDAN